MYFKPNKRREWHELYQQGVSTEGIAEMENVSELIVVKTLRSPTPKIKMANYKHLKIPIPQDELVEAYHNRQLKDVAVKYEVTIGTLRTRLSTLDISTLDKPTLDNDEPTLDDLSEEQKKEAIKAYFLSGRKINATNFPPSLFKQIMKQKEFKVKEGNSMNPRYQVALMDSLFCKFTEYNETCTIRKLRLCYEFKSNDPEAWKGQVLGWLLRERIDLKTANILNDAIEDVAQHMSD